MRAPNRLRLVACVACIVLAAAGCNRDGGKSRDGSAAGATAAPKLEKALELLALPGYAERGKTDPRYDWITAFEADTGCRVLTTVADSPADLLVRLSTPGIDVAIVPGDQVLTLVAAGDVQPIETGRVPTLARVDPRLADGAWVRHDGLRYAVPFVWRPQGLRYRTDVFPEPPDVAALFVAQPLPDGKPNAGRVQAIDSPLAIADAALYLAQAQPELGIVDPFALDARQYDAALAVLRTQSTLLHRYWSDPQLQRAELADGTAVLATGWPLASRDAAAAPLAWVAPAGDVLVQGDATVLTAHAANPQCAYAWLEWSLQPAAQDAAAAALGAVPANAQACGQPLLGADGCARHGADLLPRAFVRRPAEADCGRTGGCVPYSRWTTDFHAIRGD